MTKVICLDFDGTVLTNNVSREVLEHFAGDDWLGLKQEFEAGNTTIEQYSSAAMSLVEADEEDIASFAVSAARPRAGLGELVDWASAAGWQPLIVSASLDILVGPILESFGLGHLARHAGRARKQYRWRVRYLSPRGIEIAAGFKLSYVKALQSAGDFVVFAGDGPSDVEPARAADAVFARDSLLEAIGGERDLVYPFETFDAMTNTMVQESARWLGSPGEAAAESF
ncbi:MAG TPA: HAD-IB family phosphatase [Dehalococcoidia bacterium]|jgi:2,3-diketo-5-methylthio-1-phosphopentane phosphatase|nr:HAD-IB family phosphatase [Dehalococcoidia bacterium]